MAHRAVSAASTRLGRIDPSRPHRPAYGVWMTFDTFVADVSARINDLGWAYYFVPETLEQGETLGLDGLRFYFLGRGGVLGDVEAPVVVSAFGYFNPTLVADMWDSGKAIVAPRDAARVHFACSAELGRRRFSDLDGLAEFCAAADAINNGADPIGLALYSGFRAKPLVDDLPGRAMQLVSVLREFRGSAHLIAVRGYGLDAKAAHFMRRPNDVGMFGWTDDDPPEIGNTEQEKLAAADRLTDRLVGAAYGILDEAGQQAILAGLDQMEVAVKAG
jgi:hypothetical protein